MTDEEIVEAIDDYIDNRIYKYAIMIDGNWGSGKTFFVEKTLIPHLREGNCDVNYISLFGIKSTEEISQILCVQAIKDRVPQKAKEKMESHLGNIASSVASLTVAGMLSYFNINVDFKKLFEKFPNFNNNIIIFDDLERCGCDISLILGYINSFIEHSDASVIVIANEDEIGKWQLEDNPELQLLVALDKRLIVETEKTAKERKKEWLDQEYETDPEQLELEKLELRRKAIFNSNTHYSRMKEKVIGRTIHYEPDLKTVYSKLIEEKVKPEAFRSVLLQRLEKLVEFAKKDKHENIRTFQFFLEKIVTVFNAIDNRFSLLHEDLIQYCFRSSIRFMSGKPLPKWEDGVFGRQSFGDDIFSLEEMMGFQFVDEFIQSSRFNKEEAIAALEACERLVVEEARHENDPYQYIQRWYFSEDEEVVQWIEQIIQNINNDVYSTALYPGILYHMATIQVNQVLHEETEAAMLALEDHLIKLPPEQIVRFEPERFILDEAAKPIYEEHMVRLNQIIIDKENTSKKKEYQEIISTGGQYWPDKIETIMIQDHCIKGFSFIYWLYPEEIANRLKDSNNADLDLFKHLLNATYSKSTYYEHRTDDFNHLKELKKKIEGLDKSGFGEIKQFEFRRIEKAIEYHLANIAPVKQERMQVITKDEE